MTAYGPGRAARLAALCGWLVAAGSVAVAGPVASGRVEDPSGRPVEGASACLLVGGVEGLCAVTGPDGHYRLPGSEGGAVRIVARGFLPRTVAAVHQETPVALDRAALLRVRLVDPATGKPPETAEVSLVYSSGRRLGPFPANRDGLILRTLPPGDAVPVVRSEGYVESTGAPIALRPGGEHEIVVDVRRDRKPADARGSAPK